MKTAIEIKSDNNFIDENHEELLGALETLDKSLHEDGNLETFVNNASDFIRMLENHFLHEETILRGAGFSELENHIKKHWELALHLRDSRSAISSYGAANEFMSQARSKILNHELIFDQEYWTIFEQLPKHDEILIPWSSDLETGHTDIDLHHQALIRHINRFHNIFFDSASRQYACLELRSLYAYTKVHFEEEERHFEKTIEPAHIAQHESLLIDLDLLISEIEEGVYDLGNISGHLKYWFLNHLRFFDIPAFKKSG